MVSEWPVKPPRLHTAVSPKIILFSYQPYLSIPSLLPSFLTLKKKKEEKKKEKAIILDSLKISLSLVHLFLFFFAFSSKPTNPR